MEAKNWTVNVYDYKGEIIQTFSILNRTEFEASNEAMSQLPDECEELWAWTMTEILNS